MSYKHKLSYTFIDQWIQFIKYDTQTNPKHTYKRSLLITGPCGIGKSTCLYEVLHSYNYNITEFNLLDLKNPTYIKSQINNLLYYKNIQTLFMNQHNNNIIIFNEIDNISISERSIINMLIKYIKSNKEFNSSYVPIIFKANYYKSYFKSIEDVGMFLKFPLPTDNDILQFCKQYVKKYNIQLTNIHLNCLLEYLSPNYRLIQNQLDVIGIYMKQHKKFSLHKIKKLLKQNLNDLDIDIYQSTYNLFNNKLDANECSHIMSKDTKYILLLIHQNIIQYLQFNTKNTFNNKLQLLLYIYEYINFSCHVLQYYNNTSNIQLYPYINTTVSTICNSMINDEQTQLEYSKFSDIHKSPIYSKLNYKFCNLKYIRVITTKFNINEYNFQIFSHYLYYFIHKHKSKKYLIQIKNFINNWSILSKDLEKIFKLNYISKNSTKKFNYNKMYKEYIRDKKKNKN